MLGKSRFGGAVLPDGEYLLNLWVELGSLGRVVGRLKDEGVFNHVTQKTVSRQSVHQKILSWAFNSDDNMSKLRSMWERNLRSVGLQPDEEEWMEYVVSKLFTKTYKSKQERWLAEHPEYLPYAQKFARTTA